MKTRKTMCMNEKSLLFICMMVLLLWAGISINAQTICGDVNTNNNVDILDALLVAQYYVGITSGNFNPDVADVNGSGAIDIVDALLIAQYYVGLINDLTCEEPVETGTPEITPSPTPINPTGEPPVNMEELRSYLSLDPLAESQLMKNGFVVLDNVTYDKLGPFYKGLGSQDGLSTFITTDAMLHIFHVTYDHMLETAEKDFLITAMREAFDLFNQEAQTEYESIPAGTFLKVSAQILWIFSAVADALINGETIVSGINISPIETEANEYLTKIYDHNEVGDWPWEDFTEYEPRGHYTGDPELEQYFRAMMWAQKRIFWILEESTAYTYDFASAGIMGYIIRNNPIILSHWQMVYDFIASLVEQSDSITPLSVDLAMSTVFGANYSSSGYMLLEDESNRTALEIELSKDIYPGEKYIQFMGQRQVMDSVAVNGTLFPFVPGRAFPNSLDMASTILDSQTALEEHADEIAVFPQLETRIEELRTHYSALPVEEWTDTTYNYWLYTLRSLSEPLTGYVPYCMKTSLWEREKLNTQLASWSELRHDNLLYAMPIPTPSAWQPTPQPLGLVEPYPEFYSRLGDMCDMTRDILGEYGMDLVHGNKLAAIAGWADEFKSYAQKITDGVSLTSEEKYSIMDWGDSLSVFFSTTGFCTEDEPQIIADVYTYQERVLHEAMGKLHPIIIIYSEPGSTDTYAAVGCVMSYYEFYTEDNTRINDDEWTQILQTDPPPRPGWTDGFIQY